MKFVRCVKYATRKQECDNKDDNKAMMLRDVTETWLAQPRFSDVAEQWRRIIAFCRNALSFEESPILMHLLKSLCSFRSFIYLLLSCSQAAVLFMPYWNLSELKCCSKIFLIKLKIQKRFLKALMFVRCVKYATVKQYFAPFRID